MQPHWHFRRSDIVLFILAVVLAWVVLFRGLGAFGLLGPDEPRYAQIAAEMSATHDYFTPRLLGTPWFEKPILYYWMATASYRIFGISDAAARLPNALAACAIIIALGFFVSVVRGRRAAWLAVFIGLTSTFVFGFGRAASTDMPLSAALALSEFSLYLWAAQFLRPRAELAGDGPPARKQALGWLDCASFFLALAVLAKGPVAVVLEGATLLVFASGTKCAACIRRVFSPLAIAIFVLVAVPWYVLVSLQNPTFFTTFFIQHNLERFATSVYHHAQPFWFYLLVLLISVFPWTGLLLLPLLQLVRSRRRSLATPDWIERDRQYAGVKLYLALAAVIPILFFSVSRSKLPGYILPSVPPLIALLAICADDAWESTQTRQRSDLAWALAITAVLSAVVPIGVKIVPWIFAAKSARPTAISILRTNLPTALLAAAILLLALAFITRVRAAAVGIVCAVIGIAVAWLTGPVAPLIDLNSSARPLAQAIASVCGSAAVRPLGTLQTAPAEPQSDLFCNGAAVYSWNLNRNLLFGLDFYLHRNLPELFDLHAWPPRGVVAVEKQQFPSLSEAASRQRYHLVPELSPIEANWTLLRFEMPAGTERRRRAGD